MARFQVGEVYAQSFRLAFGNFMAFLRTQGVLALAMAVVGLFFTIFVYANSMTRILQFVAEPSADPAALFAEIGTMVAGALGLALLSLFVAPASYGIGLRVAEVVSAGPSGITLGEAWAVAKARYGALLGLILLFFAIMLGASLVLVLVIVGLAMGLSGAPAMAGLTAVLLAIAFFVGIVWFLLRWFPSPAIVFFEGLAPAAALRRAAQLTEGSRGAILGLVVLLVLTFAVPAGIVGSLFAPTPSFDPDLPPEEAFAQAQPSMGQQIGSWVVQTAFSLVGGFVGSCVMLLVYRKLAQPATAEPAMGPITYAPPPVPPGL